MSAIFIRVVLILCVFVLLGITCDGGFLIPKVTVIMVNDLGGGLDLSLHCKSGDDDVGEHLLHPHDTSEITFRPNFWGTTKFNCTFQWQGASHWFYIFIVKRDHDKCTTCIWSIRPDKPCMFSRKSGAFDDCFPWNKV